MLPGSTSDGRVAHARCMREINLNGTAGLPCLSCWLHGPATEPEQTAARRGWWGRGIEQPVARLRGWAWRGRGARARGAVGARRWGRWWCPWDWTAARAAGAQLRGDKATVLRIRPVAGPRPVCMGPAAARAWDQGANGRAGGGLGPCIRLGTPRRGPSGWPPGIMRVAHAMVAFDQGSRAVVKRPSLRDSGAIPVQCHVVLRGTGGIFANPSGREGGRVCCMRVSAGRRP